MLESAPRPRGRAPGLPERKLGVLVTDEAFGGLMERRFEADARDVVEITPRWLADRGRVARTVSNMARLLSPLL